jgi:microcystin degradation protein MlrC
MRIAVGALLQETNCFAPGRTALVSFQNRYLYSGPEVFDGLRGTGTEVGGAMDILEKESVELVPLIATNGGSGPIVDAETHRRLKDDMLRRLREAGPVDGVYLALHGAMVAEDADDVEGDLLMAVRAIVGDAPVAVTLDLHAHVTPALIEAADILIGYKHYPHDDAPDVARHAAKLLLQTIGGHIQPQMALAKAPILFAPHLERTSHGEPLAEFNQVARERESEPDILSVSYFPVQPWLDVPDMGFAAVAVTNGDVAKAERVARELSALAWERRSAFDVGVTGVAKAIAEGRSIEGPVILADTSDCCGGGASGDSAVVLRELLAAAPDVVSVILIVDPAAVRAAQAAGVGASLSVRVGHTIDRSRGQPVPVEGRVEHLFDGRFTYSGGMMKGVAATMGPSAVLAAGPIRILVASYPSYEWADEQYRAAGLRPEDFHFVVIKNPMNYKLTLTYAKRAYVLDTPGPASPNLRSLTWSRLQRPIYPLDDGFWSPSS